MFFTVGAEKKVHLLVSREGHIIFHRFPSKSLSFFQYVFVFIAALSCVAYRYSEFLTIVLFRSRPSDCPCFWLFVFCLLSYRYLLFPVLLYFLLLLYAVTTPYFRTFIGASLTLAPGRLEQSETPSLDTTAISYRNTSRLGCLTRNFRNLLRIRYHGKNRRMYSLY